MGRFYKFKFKDERMGELPEVKVWLEGVYEILDYDPTIKEIQRLWDNMRNVTQDKGGERDDG